jgi:diketogulonate reductase-like aldo/keto reductase
MLKGQFQVKFTDKRQDTGLLKDVGVSNYFLCKMQKATDTESNIDKLDFVETGKFYSSKYHIKNVEFKPQKMRRYFHI